MDDVVRQALVLISTPTSQQSSLAELLQQEPSLEPEELVVVYHQFYLLDTLTFHSDRVLAMLQHNYREEFKSVTALTGCCCTRCLSGKPGNVREFDGCLRSLRELANSLVC